MIPKTIVVLVALVFAAGCGGRAEEKQDLLLRAAWLRGCWETTKPPRTLEEWSPPQGGAMIGTSRTFRDGKVSELELIELTQRNNQLAFEAHPSGQPPATFLSTTVGDSAVVFENRTHDFPQQIGYRRDGPDALTAWIEGTDKGHTRRIEFSYRRIPCAADAERGKKKP